MLARRTGLRGADTAERLAIGWAVILWTACQAESPGPGVPDGSALDTAGGSQQSSTGASGWGTTTTGRTTGPSVAGTSGSASATSTNGGAPDADGGTAHTGADASGAEAGETFDGSMEAGPGVGDGGENGLNDLCGVGVDDGSGASRPLNLSGNTFAHDPTMIEADGVFYRFWTGPYIPVARSTDLMHWEDAPPVYRDGDPMWSEDWLASIPDETFNFPWAPDVSAFGGRYHLYSSFSARFGANISCITHLTTDDIAGGNWTDHGPVICSPDDSQLRYNAIDADVGFDGEGKPWLAFGSYWDGIMMFPLDENGDRIGSNLIHLAAKPDGIEAPVLFRRCGYYYLFVSWGRCCPDENRSVRDLTYRVAVGRARNITGPYLDRNGVDMIDGGGTLILQGDRTFAAAGHSDVLVHDDAIYHLYHAYPYAGGTQLRIVKMKFDEDGWPLPSPP